MKTKLISSKQYCPSMPVPRDAKDMILRQVQIEDERNHKDRPIADIPRFRFRKEKWGKVVMHAFGREIRSLIRP